MNVAILATALAGLTAAPALAATGTFQNPKLNHATFELSLCWKGPDGKGHSCPIDDVSYIDLLTTPVSGSQVTTDLASAPGSVNAPAGTLTFVKRGEDRGWWQQCQAAQQANCQVDLLLTFKFSDGFPGIAIQDTTGGTTQNTTLESADCKSIKLSNITEIPDPAGGQDCGRDAPNVYVVSFGSLQFSGPAH
jgi:hypothetical protein